MTDPKKPETEPDRPACPECGLSMHKAGKNRGGSQRWRCSRKKLHADGKIRKITVGGGKNGRPKTDKPKPGTVRSRKSRAKKKTDKKNKSWHT